MAKAKKEPKHHKTSAKSGKSGRKGNAGAGTASVRPGLSFPVVMIGAAAGGLTAFTALLKALPANSGMAFVLIQHLEPKHEGALTTILSKATAMPVVEVSDGLKVEPDHVYVIPPNKIMTIHKGALRLTPRSDVSGLQRPIDEFSIARAEEPDLIYRARDEAQKSGDYAHAIVETTHEALAVVDADFRVLTVNRSFCNLFRVSLNDMEGRPCFGTGPGQCNTPELRQRLQDVLSKSAPVKDLEVEQDFPGIGRRCLVINARRIDTTQTILIAIDDATERKETQVALEKSASTIRALLESTTQSILAVNADRIIVFANGNTEKMFGYKREDLVGQRVEILLPEDARARHAEHHRTYFANMQSRPMGIGLDLAGRRKDGSKFPVEVGLSAIDTVSAGKLAVAFVTDMTQRRRLEQAAQLQARQVRALAASLLTAQEEERRRVSRELHDQICQQLAALAIDIGGLAAEPPPEDRQSRLKELQARAVSASEAARHLAYELHSSVLDDLGLVASLQGLCKEFSERHANTELKLTSAALPASVPREVANCLYRVAQESLQNIAKHAHAKHVSVGLALQKGAFTLTVADDGVGFDQDAISGHGGLGLIGMRERARLVGAEFSITTRPGHGTRIALKVRLPDNNL